MFGITGSIKCLGGADGVFVVRDGSRLFGRKAKTGCRFRYNVDDLAMVAAEYPRLSATVQCSAWTVRIESSNEGYSFVYQLSLT